MKTSIDIPEDVYRKVKAKSALEGRSVRDVAIMLFGGWVETSGARDADSAASPLVVDKQPDPPWFASLRHYAQNAHRRYDMDSVRRSIARGRSEAERPC